MSIVRIPIQANDTIVINEQRTNGKYVGSCGKK